MRSSDILMDRVWQLESEAIAETPGFVFARITEVVEPGTDPTALHPEIQRQTANIRTDLDRFSPLEMSCLIRHGYCVGRQTCRARPDLFGADLPVTPLGTRFPKHTAPSGPLLRSPPPCWEPVTHRRRKPSKGGLSNNRHSGASGALCWITATGCPSSMCRSGAAARFVALYRDQILRALGSNEPSHRLPFPRQPRPGYHDPTPGRPNAPLDR